MRKLAIGIMSGTSLDGIDVQMALIEGSFSQTKIKPLHFLHIPYESSLKNKIKDVIEEKNLNLENITSLHFELGEAYADACIKLCETYKIKLNEIDFISCHGQTVWHIPKSIDHKTPSTLQLGEGAIIRERLKTTVVNNFRSADIAVGGEGAPLVPFADYILFRCSNKTRLILNIGGISNVTVLPKNGSLNDVIAFDIGPGNMMIDAMSKLFFNLDYDDQGNIAKKGSIIKPLLTKLLSHSFFNIKPPRSTGREMFGHQYINEIVKPFYAHSPYDLICTLTHFTAITIRDAIDQFVLPSHSVDELILCGGGSYNEFLLELIKTYIKPIKVIKLESLGFNGHAKEALAFIILAHHTLLGLPSNVIGATGAKRAVILGQVHHYNKSIKEDPYAHL
jgi:anhydro-N-acetylmuramic acid kinase